MAQNININMLTPIRPIPPNPQVAERPQSADSSSFQELFAKQLNDSRTIAFSKHAAARLQSRNLDLSKEQMTRIRDGVNKASDKGIRDSLILMDDMALVVNVRSGVIVTALDKASERDVFTNIDGAVIV